mmetsp:Transcript_64095/g.200642  ORF Transcript_64095/g.200642 Transcript_64095/m.200642 type:complete len:326 (-) Transcript_64095:2-979(-)
MCLLAMPLQPSSAPRQRLPPQPTDCAPVSAREFSHSAGSVIMLSGEPCVRHVCPPQPVHSKPSLSADCSQIWRSVMSWQFASSKERQALPPQPIDGMLRNRMEFRQMLSKVMLRAGEPCSRQLCPPHPAHTPLPTSSWQRCSLSASAQRTALGRMVSTVMSSAEASGVRQLLPSQPAQSRPTLALESSHTSGRVMSSHSASGPRHLPPHPRVSTPSKVRACAQIVGSVMDSAVAFRGRQVLPPQPRHGMFKRPLESSQVSLSMIPRHSEAAVVGGTLRKAVASCPKARMQEPTTTAAMGCISAARRSGKARVEVPEKGGRRSSTN